ncbi:hypothetical protein L484_007290 [Morus notabilis]|uniref:Uncharacterized protein n=1 Tax=Morus notabilis TaxID=981085 RepID=W9R7H3_9ROSA|nr:hypothetical protein L484_007290 [Morus notabilis]
MSRVRIKPWKYGGLMEWKIDVGMLRVRIRSRKLALLDRRIGGYYQCGARTAKETTGELSACYHRIQYYFLRPDSLVFSLQATCLKANLANDGEAEVGEGEPDVHGGRRLADAALAGGYEDHVGGFSSQLRLPIPLEDGPYNQGFWGRESWGFWGRRREMGDWQTDKRAVEKPNEHSVGERRERPVNEERDRRKEPGKIASDGERRQNEAREER